MVDSTNSKIEFQPGDVIDSKYRVRSLLGEGLIGNVYQVEVLATGAQRALKFLHKPEGDTIPDREFLDNCKFVFEKLRLLTHENIITPQAFGVVGTSAYLVFRLAEGQNLASVITDHGPLPIEWIYTILFQICAALEFSHHLGVVHRDLNSANIILRQDESAKESVVVLNFGITEVLTGRGEAALSRTGAILGDPRYMSPEQIQGQSVDVRSDIYSLGVILYEMMTGSVPFDDESVINLITKHVTELPPSIYLRRPELEISQALEAVIMRALSKEPDERQQSARILLNDFRLASGLEALPGIKRVENKEPEHGTLGTLSDSLPGGEEEEYEEEAPAGELPELESLSPEGGEAELPEEEFEESQLPERAFPAKLITAGVAVIAAALGLLVYFLGNGEPPPPPQGQVEEPAATPTPDNEATMVDQLLGEIKERTPQASPETEENFGVPGLPPEQTVTPEPAVVPTPEPTAAPSPALKPKPSPSPSRSPKPQPPVSPAASPARSPAASPAAVSPAASPAAVHPAASPAAQAAASPLLGNWWVQVTAKPVKSEADLIAERLAALGLKTTTQQAEVNNTIYFRVLVGPYETLEQAKDAKTRIVKERVSDDSPFIKRSTN